MATSETRQQVVHSWMVDAMLEWNRKKDTEEEEANRHRREEAAAAAAKKQKEMTTEETFALGKDGI